MRSDRGFRAPQAPGTRARGGGGGGGRDPPADGATGGSSDDVRGRSVSTCEDHLAVEAANEGFGFPEHDAEDERRRTLATFDSEQAGSRREVRRGRRRSGRRMAHAAVSPLGLYLRAVTIPAHRGRGAMSTIGGSAWSEATRRGTPAIVAYAGRKSRSPLRRLGFQCVGHAHHLVDRLA